MELLDKILHRDTDPIETMIAEVRVGDLVKTWVQTDVGRYIIGRAEQYEHEVLRQLAETPSDKKNEINRLQAESRIPGKFMQWLDEVMQQGEVARYQLQELEAESEGE